MFCGSRNIAIALRSFYLVVDVLDMSHVLIILCFGVLSQAYFSIVKKSLLPQDEF